MTADSTNDPDGRGHRPVAARKRRRRWILAVVGLGIVVWLVFMAISLVRALQDSHSAVSAADAARAELSSGGGILSSQSTASLERANRRFAATPSDLSSPALTPLT